MTDVTLMQWWVARKFLACLYFNPLEKESEREREMKNLYLQTFALGTAGSFYQYNSTTLTRQTRHKKMNQAWCKQVLNFNGCVHYLPTT